MFDPKAEVDELWLDIELDNLIAEMASDIESQESTTYEEDMFVEDKKYDEDRDKLVKAYNASVENEKKIKKDYSEAKKKLKKYKKEVNKPRRKKIGKIALGTAAGAYLLSTGLDLHAIKKSETPNLRGAQSTLLARGITGKERGGLAPRKKHLPGKIKELATKNYNW